MYIKAFLATLATFLVVDVLWISFILLDFYQRTLGGMMKESAAGAGAAVFYLAYTAGIVYLAVRPAIAERSATTAVLNGAILGALAYGTYTVTNYTIFDAWTLGLVISDILWGAFLTAICAAAGFYAGRPDPG